MPFRVLSPTAILGYGFPDSSFRRGLDAGPDVIAVDGGSTDPGPYYLGAGKPFVSEAAVHADLKRMIQGGIALGVPVIVGTAGGCGAAPHLAWTVAIVEHLLNELGQRMRVAVIHADIDKTQIGAALAEGRIAALPGSPAIDDASLAATRHIVGQMGTAPILHALDAGADIILCGRAYDPAVFAAPAIRAGCDPALATHMGKIVECAAIAAVPGSGRDCVLAELDGDSFTLVPLSDERAFTPSSVAAHALYEKSDPYRLPGPDGLLELDDVSYQALDGGRVRVTGTRLVATGPTIKLEGAMPIGFRTVCLAGIRDPIMIARLDDLIAEVERLLKDAHPECTLAAHVYGRDAVMGASEPARTASVHEVGLLLECLGPNQDDANAACALARSTLLHIGYPDRLATAGNLALPFSPSDLPVGEVFTFSLYHVMQIDDPGALFPVSLRELGR
ncbi:MAG: acyclic terpene utilization AtuA family protein [Geminicoccaceae bacterium]